MQDDTTRARARRSLARLTVASGLIVVSMVATLGVLSIGFLHDQDAAVTELADAARLDRHLDRTLQLLVDGETAERGYVLTGDPSFLAPLREAREDLPATLDSLGAVLAEKRATSLATALREAVESRVAFTESVVALAQAGDHDRARERIASREGMQRMDHIRSLVADAGSNEDAAVERSLERVAASRVRTEGAFVALLALAAAVLVALFVSVRRNLADAERAAEASRESEQRFRRLAEGSTDLIHVHTLDGRLEYVSPSCTTLLGYTSDEMESLPLETLVHEEDRAAFEAILAQALATQQPAKPFSQRLRTKQGGVRTFSSRLELVTGGAGVVERFHVVERDVTESLRETDRLSTLAARDDLTQLLNRRAFVEHGGALLARCVADGRHALLAFCDVDGLKTINDTLGHEAGDGVIKDAAALLRATARTSDLVARLGGDELAVLGVIDAASNADAFATRLRERIVAHNDRADRPYRVSISVGSAVFEPGSGTSLEALIAAADAAMYRQKSQRGRATTRSGESFVRPDLAGKNAPDRQS